MGHYAEGDTHGYSREEYEQEMMELKIETETELEMFKPCTREYIKKLEKDVSDIKKVLLFMARVSKMDSRYFQMPENRELASQLDTILADWENTEMFHVEHLRR